MKQQNNYLDYSITYFAGKGIDPEFIEERFENPEEYSKSIQYFSENSDYEINITAAKFNKYLRKFILLGCGWQPVEVYFLKLFIDCSSADIAPIKKSVLAGIERDLLQAELYELFNNFKIATDELSKLFLKMANGDY